MSFSNEIETLIRARYPILYVVSSEESRVQHVLMEIASRRQKKAFEWSFSTGIVAAGTSIQLQKHRAAASKDPLVALDQVIDQVEPAIYIFKDFHPFLSRNNFAIIRKLKEIALQLKNSFKTIVLVAPVLEIPTELEKEITVLNFPLPTRDDLGELLDRIIADVKEYKQVTIELDERGRQRLLQAALGLTLGEAENVFAKIIVKDERLSGDDVNEVFAEKQQIIRKSGLLEYYATEKAFLRSADWPCSRTGCKNGRWRLPTKPVLRLARPQRHSPAGCPGLRQESLRQSRFLPLAVAPPPLRYGPHVRQPRRFLRGKCPTRHFRRRIRRARHPLGGRNRQGLCRLPGLGHDGRRHHRPCFGTFLTWLSEKTAPVFVVTTANDITQLPPNSCARGDLDEIFFVDLPSVEERREIVAIHLAKRNRDPQLQPG
jgi:hypothetical protein